MLPGYCRRVVKEVLKSVPPTLRVTISSFQDAIVRVPTKICVQQVQPTTYKTRRVFYALCEAESDSPKHLCLFSKLKFETSEVELQKSGLTLKNFLPI